MLVSCLLSLVVACLSIEAIDFRAAVQYIFLFVETTSFSPRRLLGRRRHSPAERTVDYNQVGPTSSAFSLPLSLCLLMSLAFSANQVDAELV